MSKTAKLPPGPRALPSALIGLFAGALLLSGCYSGRAAWGGLRLMAQRHSVERLLADPETDSGLAARLSAARHLVDFAERELALPVGRAYDSYVELDRAFASWTVTATPELSVEPELWCFPIAGCVSYRGYFSEESARRFAGRLQEDGMDVEVGGVRAFSTLGWFRDPLLSSFLELPEPELAALLFHELAHRRMYVKNDTTFNESFVSLVEEVGLSRWLRRQGRQQELEEWHAAQRRDAEVIALSLATRNSLARIFAEPHSDDWKRERKAELLEELRAAYRARRDSWGEAWDGFFGPGLNNARLATLGAYSELVPGLRRLLAEEGGDLERFYAAAEALAELPPTARRERLEAEISTTGAARVELGPSGGTGS